MPDDRTEQDAPQPTGGDPQNKTAGGDVPFDALPESWQQHIRELRQEAKDRRLALDAAEAESRKREQTRLAEEGKWRELAEARQQELESLKPYQERATLLESRIQASNAQRIERIPEHMRKIVPNLPPEELATWLDASADILIAPRVPDTDAGAGGGRSEKLPELTPEEKQMAQMAGMTPEQYAARKQKIGRD